MRLIRLVAAGVFAVCLLSHAAMAQSCSGYPWTNLTNGNPADATQVMNNFDCVLSSPFFSSNVGIFGNLGIGTTSPSAPLHIVNTGNATAILDTTGSSSSTISGIQFRRSGVIRFGLTGANGNSGTDDLQIGRITDSGSFFVAMFISRSTGNFGVGTGTPGQALEVAGTIRQHGCTTAGSLAVNSSGDIICSSDARLKDVLGKYEGGLDAINQIVPERFRYKSTKSDPHETFIHAGFVAQNVKAVIPEASALQRDGYYSLDTTAVLAASVNAIKQLKAINDEQVEKINRLEDRLSKLERKGSIKLATR